MYREWFAQFPVKKFDKDSTLFMQGDTLNYCYYLKKGICSQLIYYENGIEVVPKYHFPGDLMNVWGVLKNKTAYASTAVAKVDVYAAVIPASRLRRELEENFSFYRWVVESILMDNQYVYEQYHKKSKGSAAEILCYAILTMSQTGSDGELYLPKEFSFLDLARHLRIHRITVSYIFKALQEENIIQKCNVGWRILDVQALESYSQGNLILNYGAPD